MSEYQYYDFRAVDRALTEAETDALRSISTRAVITSTSFTNHYEWGNLKADPLKLLEKFFDAFVYVANWGTHQFCLRLPQKLADYKQFSALLSGEAAWVQKTGRYLIVGFETESDGDGDWDDGSGWMGSLVPLRSDLLRGDLRCLYLGWLLSAQNEELDEDEQELPVPAGLGELSAPLRSLIEFLGIDENLVEVAATTSAPLGAGPGRQELAEWIQRLPAKEKDDLLVTAALQSGESWRIELLRRFHQEMARQTPHAGVPQRRTVGDLLAAARVRAEERTRRRQKDQARHSQKAAPDEGPVR